MFTETTEELPFFKVFFFFLQYIDHEMSVVKVDRFCY